MWILWAYVCVCALAALVQVKGNATKMNDKSITNSALLRWEMVVTFEVPSKQHSKWLLQMDKPYSKPLLTNKFATCFWTRGYTSIPRTLSCCSNTENGRELIKNIIIHWIFYWIEINESQCGRISSCFLFTSKTFFNGFSFENSEKTETRWEVRVDKGK